MKPTHRELPSKYDSIDYAEQARRDETTSERVVFAVIFVCSLVAIIWLGLALDLPHSINHQEIEQ